MRRKQMEDMTYMEGLAYIGRVMRWKNEVSHDLYGRICVERSCGALKRIKCHMTYTGEFVQKGHEAAEKDKTSYDLYRRICIKRS